MTGTSENEAALLRVSRKLREGYALALHGLEVTVDEAHKVVHLRPRADAGLPEPLTGDEQRRALEIEEAD